MEKEIEKLADWYHGRLHDYVGHSIALREVIKKAIELGIEKGENYQRMSNEIQNSKVH